MSCWWIDAAHLRNRNSRSKVVGKHFSLWIVAGFFCCSYPQQALSRQGPAEAGLTPRNLPQAVDAQLFAELSTGREYRHRGSVYKWIDGDIYRMDEGRKTKLRGIENHVIAWKTAPGSTFKVTPNDKKNALTAASIDTLDRYGKTIGHSDLADRRFLLRVAPCDSETHQGNRQVAEWVIGYFVKNGYLGAGQITALKTRSVDSNVMKGAYCIQLKQAVSGWRP